MEKNGLGQTRNRRIPLNKIHFDHKTEQKQ